MQALSFREYREMKRFLGQAVDPNPVAELDRYILEGAFPEALDYPKMADKRAYARSVIKEIFERDIRGRVKVKNVSVFNGCATTSSTTSARRLRSRTYSPTLNGRASASSASRSTATSRYSRMPRSSANARAST